MIGAALVLTFVTSFYARHAGGYSGQGRMMGQGYGASVENRMYGQRSQEGREARRSL